MRSYYTFPSLILGVIFLIGLSWQSLTVVHFYTNQVEIEQEHCVNKAQPKKNCHGKCYLNDQLEKSELTKEAQTSERLNFAGTLIFQFHEIPLDYLFSNFLTKFLNYSRLDEPVNSGFLSILSPPPQFS